MKTVRCPYIPEHIMPEESLITHLHRCKATNKHEFTNCPNNSNHIIRKDDLPFHIQSKCFQYTDCPDSKQQNNIAEQQEDEFWGEVNHEESCSRRSMSMDEQASTSAWGTNLYQQTNDGMKKKKNTVQERMKFGDWDVEEDKSILDVLNKLNINDMMGEVQTDQEDQLGTQLAKPINPIKQMI